MDPGKPIPIVASFRSAVCFCVLVSRTLFSRKFSPTLWICLTLTLYCSSTFALDPNQPLSQLHHTSWNARQGVSGNVTALVQTTDGYLWLGTTEGLLRFDGSSFEQYQPENGSLIARDVSALMAVPGGGLWVGFTVGGASFISNGRVINYSNSDGFPVSTVRCFARDPSGAIWAAAVGGFVRLEGQRWQKVRSDWNYPAKTAWRLMVDREGTLWVATGSQIAFLPKGAKQFQSAGIQAGNVFVLAQAPDGAILFYDDDLKKLRAFRRGGEKKIESLLDVDTRAHSALFDRDGGLWLGGDGLSRMPFPDRIPSSGSKQTAERFTEAEGLSNESVEAILEDREGNIWVGTDGGLDRFRHRNVTWFPLRGSSFSLVAGPGGDVWAGSRGDFPVARVEDRRLAGGGPTDVFAVYHDPDGSVWYSANSSLLHWENGRFVKISVPQQVLKLSLSATPPDPIIASSITKDRSENLWVAFGGSGEFRLRNGIWTFVPILPDHPDWSANYSFTDSADRIWLSWGDRIACYDHGNIQVFGAKEGLAIGPPNLMAGEDQHIWVGGESGLSLFQDGRFHTIHSAEVTGFTSVTGIVAVRNGGLWLSTGPGIIHIPESEIQNVFQHPEHKVAFEMLDLVSDLPEPIQRGDEYSPGAIQGRDGTIWFATQRGAVRADPAHIYRNPLPPPVSIRSITADDKSYSPFSSPALPALTKNLRIEYAALSLSIPERVRFRYKLEGWDNQWHEAGGRREAFFTNLAPTRYSFRVIACNNDGVWSEMGATLNFSVAPAWFQTNWFRAFCTGVFLLLMWTLYQLRLKQLERRFRVGLEARVNERTRIARELHDTLLQSLHGLMFQFQAARNMLPRRPEEAIQTLDGAIMGTEQAIAESRDAIQDLRSEVNAQSDLPQLLTAAAEELGGLQDGNHDAPAFRVIVEGERQKLVPMIQDEVYRIAREVLRNAFRHARAHLIEVEIRYDESQLRLRIRDDGTGMGPKVLRDSGRAGHWGLPGVRERAQAVGARLDFWSEAEAGTEVELSIPATIAYEELRGRIRLKLFRSRKS
jgi:signal transduction histidine kinase/ligand-binding sensor domain-containing protein